jgi:hypothetical protein
MSENFDIQNDDRERDILKALHDRSECDKNRCDFCADRWDAPAFDFVDEDVDVSKAITFRNGAYESGR